jgi:Dolichyl-phosphate-mannose-protein mannosyltransferase
MPTAPSAAELSSGREDGGTHPARPADPAGEALAGNANRRLAWFALALVLGGGLALRLWGVRQGLPYAYNADENDHFVPRAVAMFGASLNPHYFANPPAFTYLLHWLFAIVYGGTHGVRRELALHATGIYTLARVAAAVLGTAALWLLYAAGARLFNRGVALLAAAIEAVAFLPVFYSHLALNDVPTLAPLTLSLLGSAGILVKGRTRDYLLAGAGLGLACATKYTAGIVLVPLLAASAVRIYEVGASRRTQELLRLALAGALALAAFIAANPYALLDYSHFHHELAHQSSLSAAAQGKLGAPRDGGLEYYLWSLTWGLGWVPSLAALGGAVTVSRRRPRVALVLVPATVIFLVLMGTEGRYFGRWLLPVFPLLCLLAAAFVADASLAVAGAVERLVRGRAGSAAASLVARPLRPAVIALLAAATLAQGTVYSVHAGVVLSRADTRNITREWMIAHVPAGSRIVAEPVSPDEWARFARTAAFAPPGRYRWPKYPSLVPRVAADGSLLASPGPPVGIEDYERTLSPSLIDYYRAHRYCYVLSGSTESGRAFADPHAVPRALAYYRALANAAEVAFRATPYRAGEHAVPFNFDWSFDYYPLAYARPGPYIVVYRLRGGACGS